MLLHVSGGRPRQDVADVCGVPLRLSLLVDIGMSIALVLLALRLRQLVELATRHVRISRTARPAFWAACVGAALNLVENGVLWARADTVDDGSCSSPWVGPGLSFPVLTVLAYTLLAGGVAWLAGLNVRHWWLDRRDSAQYDLIDVAAPPPVKVAEPSGTILCCSGGGIRSASFCLGGLQQLTERGIYGASRAVVGVSGGGYIAAAFHALRTPHAVPAGRTRPGEEPVRPAVPVTAWDGKPPEVFGEPPHVFDATSPELARLRRQTRYMASSAGVMTLGLMSLLFGLAVNVALLAVLLRLAAWILGWLLHDAGALDNFDTADAGVSFNGGLAWLDDVWWAVVAGLALFSLEKVFDRYRSVPHKVREAWRRTAVGLVWFGAGAAAVLVGIPHAQSALHDLATHNEPSIEVAGALHAMGFASVAACDAATRELGGACGKTGPEAAQEGFDRGESGPLGGLLAVFASVLAVAQAAKGGTKSADGSAGGWLSKQLTKAWSRLRDVVLPWAATAVISVTMILVLLRWTQDLALYPELRQQWGLMAWCGGILIAVKVLTDANSTSLHHFYRERLTKSYLVHRRRDGKVSNFPYHRPLRFSRAQPEPLGNPGQPGRTGPHLVLCAAANVADAEWIPTDRNCTPFVFSDDRIGFTDAMLPDSGCLSDAAVYEWVADRRYRDATIPAAMAISGAAFSPMAGRQSHRSRPYRLVMALANARLGVWLPNPYWIDGVRTTRRLIRLRSDDAVRALRQLPDDEVDPLAELLRDTDLTWVRRECTRSGDPAAIAAARRLPRRGPRGRARRRQKERSGRIVTFARWCAAIGWTVMDKPGPFRLFKEAFGKSSLMDRKIYVTDGGHYDNLGLVEALRRKPERIFVLDASADDEDTFGALGEAIATARMDLNVEVDFDPRRMRRLEESRAPAAWGYGTAKHPDGSGITHVYVAKVVLIEGLPWDIETYATRNPSFPRTSTGDQLYGEWDFEAYRELGSQLVTRLLDDASIPERPWSKKSGWLQHWPFSS